MSESPSARRFTLEEATRALEQVRPLAEAMVAAGRALAEATERQTGLSHRIAGNGGGMSPGELAGAQTELGQAVGAVAEAVDALHELGVLVKDVERGLVDFPARRGDEDVLLCWHVGEDEIGYWHGFDEGFAGRKRLPF